MPTIKTDFALRIVQIAIRRSFQCASTRASLDAPNNLSFDRVKTPRRIRITRSRRSWSIVKSHLAYRIELIGCVRLGAFLRCLKSQRNGRTLSETRNLYLRPKQMTIPNYSDLITRIYIYIRSVSTLIAGTVIRSLD